MKDLTKNKKNLVLEKILDGLADVIEYQTKNQTTNSRRTVERGVNKSGELSDFYAYLIESGKTHTTADNYRKAVMQAINAMEYSGVEELNAKVDAIIFTAGVLENNTVIRETLINKLSSSEVDFIFIGSELLFSSINFSFKS